MFCESLFRDHYPAEAPGVLQHPLEVGEVFRVEGLEICSDDLKPAQHRI